MTVVVLGHILQASPKAPGPRRPQGTLTGSARARQAKLANGEDVLAGDGPIRASGMSETEAMRSTCHPELPGGPPLIRCAPTRAPSADEHPRPRPAATASLTRPWPHQGSAGGASLCNQPGAGQTAVHRKGARARAAGRDGVAGPASSPAETFQPRYVGHGRGVS